MKTSYVYIVLRIVVLFMIIYFIYKMNDHKSIAVATPAQTDSANCWTGAGVNQIPIDAKGSEIRYGRQLIQNTAFYFGPKGTVQQLSNGMNCQNCHLEAGTKPWGNNYGAVASTYPKFRARSGSVETIEKRVNDCFERSLNGKAINTVGREMRAIIAYIKWLGNDIPKNTKPKGSGIMQLPYLSRAADPVKGRLVYVNTCSSCHGTNGEGQQDIEKIGFTYPPLWGAKSYNDGAGIFRISRLAGYVKNNMPNPVNYHSPQLSDEQAWDVAAYINSQPRPKKDLRTDWPDIKQKPVDHPFGPYADTWSEERHKYGPFIK